MAEHGQSACQQDRLEQNRPPAAVRVDHQLGDVMDVMRTGLGSGSTATSVASTLKA